MAVNYDRLKETATRLITENGRAATLVLASSVPADPAKPWAQPEDVTESSIPVTAVFFEVKSGESPLAIDESVARPVSSDEEYRTRVFFTADDDLPGPLDSKWYMIDDTDARYELLAVVAVRPGPVLIHYIADARL